MSEHRVACLLQAFSAVHACQYENLMAKGLNTGAQ